MDIIRYIVSYTQFFVIYAGCGYLEYHHHPTAQKFIRQSLYYTATHPTEHCLN